MNWLAHLCVTDDAGQARLGQLAGDFVRGDEFDALRGPLREGVVAHRALDVFTDSHDVVRRSRARVQPPLRRFAGNLWSMARLAKAAFTYSGGIDYIAWKIERHSGHRIELSAWQKRHPLLTGLVLLPQLLRRGVVR